MSTQFYVETSSHMRKALKNGSTRAIALIVFYYNRNSLVFKVLGVVVYFFIDKYLCVDYLCLQIEAKFSLLHGGFENTSFDELSRIFIPEILLNVLSCYGDIQDNSSTLILACRIKLVSYYLSKGVFIIEKFLKP